MSSKDPKIDSAIKTGNYKSALKLTQQKIQQYPNSSYFYALECKVLALLKNKVPAMKKANDLLSKFPSDPETLKLLISVFEICEADDELTEDIFEKVSKKYPTFNLVYDWLSYAVDNGDLIGMQKSTMMLTKAINNGPAFIESKSLKLWASTMLVIVCQCCQNSLNPPLLKLYPMLGSKMMESLKPSNAQETFIYCKLLNLSGKTDDCLKELKLFLNKENDLELKLMYFEILKENGLWDELYSITEKYLVESKEDDWDTWKLFIKASNELTATNKCLQVIKDYQVTRNSQLAYIELSKTTEFLDFSEWIANYLTHYGHKLCCFPDLKIFVTPTNTKFDIFEKELEKRGIAGILNKSRKPTESELIFMVNYLKFKSLIDQRDCFSSTNFIKECCLFYSSTKSLLDKLVKFEYFAGFEFIILAVQSILIQSDDGKLSSELLIKIIIILEFAVSKNPYEFHLKLWLTKLYTKINAISESIEIHKSLAIKSIQFDTLSYNLTTRLSTSTTNNEQLMKLSNFYGQNASNELPHMISNCFQKLALNKLQSFIEFQIRVDKSFTKISNCLELIKTNRVLEDQESIVAECIPNLKKFFKIMKTSNNDKFTNVSDNRDLKTFWDCGIHEPIEPVAKKLNLINPELDIIYVKLMIYKELIIYDYESKYYTNYVSEFLEIFRSGDCQCLTEMEIWNLSIIARLLDPDSESMALPTKPENLFNFNFNHYFFTLIDTSKQLQFIINKQAKKQPNDKIKWLKKINTDLANKIKAFRSDVLDFKIEAKKQVEVLKVNAGEWFQNDDVGKCFEIEPEFINGCFRKIVQANEESLVSLRKI